MPTAGNPAYGQERCRFSPQDSAVSGAQGRADLANGIPTGVEVVGGMVHGGPYPDSINFGAASVGTTSIRRLPRPASYQYIPADVLPVDLEAAR